MSILMQTTLHKSIKTKILIEALPWIQEFYNSIVVVKYGGNAMVKDELRQKFAEDIVFMKAVGLKPVVVHGGGPQISKMLNIFGIESEFKEGFRVTSKDAMDVVRMVLTGKISRELVGLINSISTKRTGYAVGMSGEDAGLFSAKKKFAKNSEDDTVDLGMVGDIVNVDTTAVLDLLKAGRIPIISSVAPDIEDQNNVLNINADTAAGALAVALNAEKLIILTDVEGLYSDFSDKSTLISRIGTHNLREMISDLQTGMIPKMQSALNAVENGVRSAHIIDGRSEHSILEEIFTDQGIGTQVIIGDVFETENLNND